MAAWQGFAVPKRGNSPDELEDAFAAAPKAGRFAVADGASESSFASLWAKLLVDGFAHRFPSPASPQQWLEPLRRRWSAEVGKLRLPWYADAKRDLGAAAAFLGLALRRSPGTRCGTWAAMAVGDCCLFQLRREQLVRTFPVLRSADFDNQPPLLSSRPGAGGSSLPHHRLQRRGRWCRGDRFLLMTDALAQWFLSCHEGGQRPWETIEEMLAQPRTDEARFAAWVDGLRERRGLRNDDVALVIIDL